MARSAVTQGSAAAAVAAAVVSVKYCCMAADQAPELRAEQAQSVVPIYQDRLMDEL